METRKHLEQVERDTLAPYAAFSDESRGREHPVPPCPLRTEYQRDRDRIIHCAAFRKLEYKTQVYVIHEGDYYRTRLTHTMEVAQIARGLARSLRLNADLAEAVALAHDMGHTPFGHGGEAVLHRLMRDHGGFEHNSQGLRIVEVLEERYEDFAGLNLTWELREGIAKHTTSYDSPRRERFEPDLAPPLESQLVDVADEIAYNQHDLDDALKMGLVRRADFGAVPWIDELFHELVDRPGRAGHPLDDFARCRIIGALIDRLVHDVLDATQANIEAAGVRSLADVRRAPGRLVAFSPATRERNREIRAFLMKNVYRHPHVVRMVGKGERFIEELFHLYHNSPAQLPFKYQERLGRDGLERVIADYISGMTDRYCLDEYRRIFLP